MLFAPHHLLALFTLGIPSGLIMDCGYSETMVLPISFERPFNESYFQTRNTVAALTVKRTDSLGLFFSLPSKLSVNTNKTPNCTNGILN